MAGLCGKVAMMCAFAVSSMTLMGCGGKCDVTALQTAANDFATKTATCGTPGSAEYKTCFCGAWATYEKAYDDNTGGCGGDDKKQADAAMAQVKALVGAMCGSSLSEAVALVAGAVGNPTAKLAAIGEAQHVLESMV
jgi:hypothetical protein